MLLGIEGGGRDNLLSFLIEDNINLILNYCRILELPPELESLLPVMAADRYRRTSYGQEKAGQGFKVGNTGFCKQKL